MKRKVYLVVMAAGRGTRMSSETPKQFMELGGKPVLQRTIEKFICACPDIKVVTVLPKEHIDHWKDLCLKNNFICPQTLVAGGITRFHSVKNALEKVPEGAVVAIHDGVRPLLSPEMIKAMLERFEKEHSCRALIPVRPSTDTLVAIRQENKGGKEPVLSLIEGRTLDREEIFSVQTPQIFLSEEIKDAYASQGYETSFTDDASVAAKNGTPLAFCMGERLNIKLTTPEDMVFASAVLKENLKRV